MKREVMADNKKLKKENRNKRGTIVGLSIALGVLGLSTIGLGIAYGVSMSQAQEYSIQLENVYQKNMYDLVESVNNIDTKLQKVLVSKDKDFQAKTLVEVSNNTELAQQSISSLPISQDSISQSVSFINQVGGYSSVLAKKLSKGGSLTGEEKKTLSEIQEAIQGMKNEINEFMIESEGEVSILNQSLSLIGDKNSFTIKLSRIQDENLDYPTMIYDGPFSDSETNVDIKGLSGDLVDQSKAQSIVQELFKDASRVSYEGEINSKIETYNFNVITTTDHNLYVQVSKIGGNIITVSGTSDSVSLDNFDLDTSEKLALAFVKLNGIENPKCVWRGKLQNEAYFNIAPVQNGVILYPDLVKVKIDLSSGKVIGYDASTYFTNHTQRLLPKPAITQSDAKEILPNVYIFKDGRLVLAPLDYMREVLCYEFIGEKGGEIYYFYINAQTGKEENILKVIETSDGAKLM